MADTPIMKTIREISSLGVMPEHALRALVKQGKIPYITVGKTKVLINYSALCEQLSRPEIKGGASNG